MVFLKWLFGILLTLTAIVLAIAYSLPNEYQVSRSIQIHASADKIYPHLASPKAWKKWSIWNQRDPAMQIQYSGPESGVDAAWQWQSQTQGNGGMKFIQAEVNQQLMYELHFQDMNYASSGELILKNEGNATKVTWSMKGNNQGNLMMKLFSPFMDKMVGADFEAGLQNLKKLAEQT